MANAAQASVYELFTIQKNNKTVDISGESPASARVMRFDYYESLLSPNITAILSLIDLGGSVKYDQEYDSQTRFGTLTSALPLNGDVSVSFKIRSKLGNLDFTGNPLVFDSQINPDQESNREAIVLSLISKTAKINQESSVLKTYSGNISDSVKKIIKEYLKTPDEKILLTPTKNPCAFDGNSESVFELLCWLASQSAPVKGNPGYFFYETKNGINFKSIDELIGQEAKESYFLSGVLRSGIDNDENDFKIAFKSDIKREDLLSALKAGVYVNRNIFFDIKMRKYEEIIYKLDTGSLETSLGKKAEIPTVNRFTRTHFHIKGNGTREPTPAGEVNNDPKEWQAKATMRYNLLFTQVVQIQVPCNPNLVAGDTINCTFEPITQDNKSQGPDPVQSGKYLILNLCHHFDPLRSFTSMTLVRDTYGLYTSKNK